MNPHTWKSFVAAGVVIAIFLAPAAAQDWSKWELNNSLAQAQNWLVIKRSASESCYLKQSYKSDPSKMEILTSRSGDLVITAPSYNGFVGDIIYQVDDGKRGVIDASALKLPNIIPLPKDIIPDLKAGRNLRIFFRPIGKLTRTQNFSLMGFTAGEDGSTM